MYDLIWFDLRKCSTTIGIVLVITVAIPEVGLCSLSQGWFPSLWSLRSLRLLQRKLSNPYNYLFPHDHYSDTNHWDTLKNKVHLISVIVVMMITTIVGEWFTEQQSYGNQPSAVVAIIATCTVAIDIQKVVPVQNLARDLGENLS